MKQCSKCGEEKIITQFNWKYKSKGIRNSQCKICSRKAINKHYKANHQYYIDRNEKRRIAIYKWLYEYKETNPCKDCGKNYPHYVMEFDHLEPNPIHRVSGLISAGWGPVKKEIAKCDLVCSNCHSIRTYRRRVENHSLEV